MGLAGIIRAYQERGDSSPKCGSSSKSCKTASGRVVCIPKNRECRSESEFIKGAKRGAGFAATSVAGGAAAALGAIAVEKALKTNKGTTVNIKNKTVVKEAPVSEIRKKSKEERTPDEVAVIQKARAGLISKLLVRKLAATSGLDVKPEEEGFLADEIQDIINDYKNKKKSGK